MKNLNIAGFRRPISSCMLSNSSLIAITESHENLLYIFSSDKKECLLNPKDLGMKSPTSIACDDKDRIAIVDDFDGSLHFFDQDWNKLFQKSLSDRECSFIKFNKELNGFIIAFIGISKIFSIYLDLEKEVELLDFSHINIKGPINSLDYYKRRLFLLHDEGLVEVNLDRPNSYDSHLSYGRDGTGKVRQPSDLNIINDKIYINDNKNYLIQVFDLNLKFITQIGSKGNKLDQFDLPVSSFYKREVLFINDKNNDRILKLDTKFFSSEVIVKDKFTEGQLRRPSGIDINSFGNIYVSDRSNGVIQIFNSKLDYLCLLDSGSKKFNRPSSVSLIENNKEKYLIILERDPSLNTYMTVNRLSSDGLKIIDSIEKEKEIDLKDSQDMDIGKDNTIFIADTLNRRIVNLRKSGKFISEVNLASISNNKKILIKTICVRSDGHIFTADFDECVVYEFDQNLKFLSTIDFIDYKDKFIVLRGLYVTMDEIYICNRGESQVSVFDYKANFIRSIESELSMNKNWNHPVKVRLTPGGVIVIADKENDRLLSFDKNSSKFLNTTFNSN